MQAKGDNVAHVPEKHNDGRCKKTDSQGKEDLDEDNERGKKYVTTEMDTVINHHEDKKNRRYQEVKKTGHYGCQRKNFTGEIYLGNEITVVNKARDGKGQ